MKLLLDTHTFLWFVMGSERLSAKARSLIEDLQNERFLSVASAWEMAIKLSLGKLRLAQPVETFLVEQMAKNNVTLLAVELVHVTHVATLPFHHRDPFDRALVAQAAIEDMTLVSTDDVLGEYGIKRAW